MTRDPWITRACPFCREEEHLRIHPLAISRPIIEGGDTRKLPNGEEELQEVDAVGCDVCDAMAPLDIWNNGLAPEAIAILRDFDAPKAEVA